MAKSEKTDFTEQYRALWASPFGADILRVLNELHDSLITDAEKEADSQDKAYGLLKAGAGVMLAVSHLKGRGAQVVSKARSDREE